MSVNRDTFRLMTKSPDGRKALVGLLVAVVAPGPLDPNDKSAKLALDNTLELSFVRFASDWMDLQKAAKPNMLIDTDPAILLIASGVRPLLRNAAGASVTTTTRTASVRVPGLTGGSGSRWAAPPKSTRNTPSPNQTQSGYTYSPPPLVSPAIAHAATAAAQKSAAADKQAVDDLAATLVELVRYEAARSVGYPGLVTQAQPSNPRAFIKLPVKAPVRASNVVNTVLLAGTIGLTEGDRKFLAKSLADAAKAVGQPKVTANTLARAVFEGPEFADMLANGALPDRDEFKDRFVAGLHHVLMKDYPATKGFNPDRSQYASGPKYDPKLAEEKEVAAVPTTACLRCHEVRPTGKARVFEPIPALAFDPFDEKSRAEWLKTASKEAKHKVLARLYERLFTDGDMPPEDSAEREVFRTKQSDAFDDLKVFLESQLEKPAPKKKP